jgi:prevent-host-death family protein
LVNQILNGLTMSSIPVYEAKTRLSELLTQVQQGEEFTITRHGVAVARLTAPALPGDGRRAVAAQRRSVDAAFAALSALREGVTLDVPLSEAIRSGRD